jgi:chitin disaccharide deacetylase
MRSLIINADDMGASQGINQGIISAFEHGALFSTSLVVNLCAFQSACLYLLQNQDLHSGLHLNLTTGRPVSNPENVRSLINRDGQFLGPWKLVKRLYRGRIKPGHVWREMNAQMEKALQVGLHIRHVDSHHHVHVLAPLRKMVNRLAKEFSVTRVRQLSWPKCVRSGGCSRKAYLQQATLALMASKDRALNHPFYGFEFALAKDKKEIARSILMSCQGRGEWMCHPALFIDKDMHRISHYITDRITEHDVLTEPEILALIAQGSAHPRH